MKPSRAVETLPRSGIRKIMELAWTVKDCIHLEVGEPNFPTPMHAIEAADRAARDGFTRYTPNAGIPPLREALAEKVRVRNGINALTEQIIVTPGAVAGIYSSLAALVNPGEEVLISDPSWPNYRLMADLLGLRAVSFPLRAGERLVPRAADIEAHITDRTRAIILNSPGNPTGATTPLNVLSELLELARRHDLWVLSDEVYDEIWFEEQPVSMATMDDQGRVITFFSFSKTYAMTGWRVGYLVAPQDIAPYIIKMQEPIVSCVNAPAQMAAIAAVTGPQDLVVEMRRAYHRQRDLVVGMLERAGVPYIRPAGAFYLMADISTTGMEAGEFCRRLVVERGVAVAPGSTFGPNSGAFVRISFATDSDLLAEGVDRLVSAVGDWDQRGGNQPPASS